MKKKAKKIDMKMSKKPMAKVSKLPEVRPEPPIQYDPMKRKASPMARKAMKKKGC